MNAADGTRGWTLEVVLMVAWYCRCIEYLCYRDALVSLASEHGLEPGEAHLTYVYRA